MIVFGSLLSYLSGTILVIAVAINLVLAYMVYRSSPKNATNRLFSIFALVISAWLTLMYMAPNPEFAPYNLQLIRLTIFVATPMDILLFLLAYTLPAERINLGRNWQVAIYAIGILMMALALSPYTFTGLEPGSVKPLVGMGLPFAGGFSVILIVAAVYQLLHERKTAETRVKKQIQLMLGGILVMFGLIVTTIFLPTLISSNDAFVPLSPLYALVFLGATAYAIVKYQLFNLKVIATEALTAVIWIVLFAKIVSTESLEERMLDGLIFVIILAFGILLIRSVRKEVEQREVMEDLTQQLQQANTKLTELSRFKTQLLSLASHQLKSPLAVIKGFASLLMQDMYGPLDQKVKDVVSKMKASADQLISLVNTLLDLRKVEEGRMDYQFATTDLSAMIESVVESLRPLAAEKKLALKWTRPEREIFVSADLRTLPEVFRNLVDNAIKYTPQGEVAVEIRTENGKAIVGVTDTGLGVSAELLPRLFEEFVRDERVRKEIQGTGFGLYIARKIVEAHGGKIFAESPGQGKGSTFSVALPLL